MKILKRAAALTAALLITISIVIKPIRVNAIAGEVVAGAITAGSVWGAVAGGLGIGLAVSANAVADGLSNGTIDNSVEQWLSDKASEWEYGYTQAQVNGEIFKAELTYGDLKSLAALLSEAYPEGQIQTSRGHIVNLENTSDFPISLPIDTEIYFTDISQTGETALTYRFYYSDTGSDYSGTVTTYELPSGSSVSSKYILLLNEHNYAHTTGFTAQIESDLRIHTHLFLDVSPKETDIYIGLRDFPGLFSENTLISYSMPTFVPGEGIDIATSSSVIPYGTSSRASIKLCISAEVAEPTPSPGTNVGIE